MRGIAGNLTFRKLEKEACEIISNALKQQGWDKPVAQYEDYFDLQEQGKRDIIVAILNNTFVGYLTINWHPDYPEFKKRGIPEIVDLNVLIQYQRLGIGSELMNEAEKRIKKVSDYAGIGFGVTRDYGPAQILYVKRGYIPDGNGLVKSMNPLEYGNEVTIDDDLVFYLVKKL